jgi:hypothetical protein
MQSEARGARDYTMVSCAASISRDTKVQWIFHQALDKSIANLIAGPATEALRVYEVQKLDGSVQVRASSTGS